MAAEPEQRRPTSKDALGSHSVGICEGTWLLRSDGVVDGMVGGAFWDLDNLEMVRTQAAAASAAQLQLFATEDMTRESHNLRRKVLPLMFSLTAHPLRFRFKVCSLKCLECLVCREDASPFR